MAVVTVVVDEAVVDDVKEGDIRPSLALLFNSEVVLDSSKSPLFKGGGETDDDEDNNSDSAALCCAGSRDDSLA